MTPVYAGCSTFPPQAGRITERCAEIASAEERAGIIDTARGAGARVIGYFFASSLDECAARNRQRPEEARVPDVGMFATARRFVRPSRREGFDDILTVQSLPDFRFDIGPYPETPDEPR